MTQSQFMYELMKELDGMSDEKKYDIMNDYTGFFSEQTDNGRSPEEIISMLHSPKEIAESYKKGKPVELDVFASGSEDDTPAYKRVVKFILLIPCALVIVPLSALAGALLVALSVVLCVAGVAVSVYLGGRRIIKKFASSLSFGFIIIGIGGILFTFSFVMLCVSFIQLTAKMVKSFPNYMGRVLNNTDRSVK